MSQESILKNILAIETSCDETAVSIIQGEFNAHRRLQSISVLSHEVESQHTSHAPFGGVVPEVAARDHLSKISFIAQAAILRSGLSFKNISEVAVTLGPGLIGALMVGVLFARGLAASLEVPLIGINHVDAHLTPAILLKEFSLGTQIKKKLNVCMPAFPALALTVSGGHCHMSYLENALKKEQIGKSLDDACGEAFDKVAKLLGLGYPGGAALETLAAQWNPSEPITISFPSKIEKREHGFNFSYSGLKTAVLDLVRKETGSKMGKVDGSFLPLKKKQEIAYGFQKSAIEQLFYKVNAALQQYSNIKTILVAGGVAQNNFFRDTFSVFSKERDLRFAPAALCSDNATMIGLHALLGFGCDGFECQPFSKY